MKIKIASHQCDWCLKDFPTKYNWSRHVAKCNGERPAAAQVLHSCTKSSKVFGRKENLTRHAASCQGPSVEPMYRTCTSCTKVFETVSNLNQHRDGHCPAGAKGPDVLYCSKCGKTFIQQTTLKTHEDSCTGKHYKCLFCPRVFNTIRLRYIHCNNEHPTEKYLHKCKTCNKQFVRSDKLSRHAKSCNRPSVDPMYRTCNSCKQEFKTVSNLNDHRDGHCPAGPKGTDVLYCNKCGKKFIRQTTLKAHEDTCTGNHYTCWFCPAVFDSLTRRHHHRVAEHPDQKVANSKSSLDNKRYTPPSKTMRLQDGTVVPKTRVVRHTSPVRLDPLDFEESLIFPPTLDKDEHEVKLKETIENNWQYIRSHSHHGKFEDCHVIRLQSTDMTDIHGQLRQLFENQKTKFKINVSFGGIMRHKETAALRYWHASHGSDRLLDFPRLIRHAEDFEEFLQEIAMNDVVEWARLQRPDTKEIVDMMTNAVIFITKIIDSPIG